MSQIDDFEKINEYERLNSRMIESRLNMEKTNKSNELSSNDIKLNDIEINKRLSNLSLGLRDFKRELQIVNGELLTYHFNLQKITKGNKLLDITEKFDECINKILIYEKEITILKNKYDVTFNGLCQLVH